MVSRILYHAYSRHRTVGLRLLYLEPFHEPTILLRGYLLCLHCGSRPLVHAGFQTLIQKHKTILLPVQTLDTVSPAATEQKQRIGEGIQFELLLYQGGQSIYSFSKIRIAAGDIDAVCTAEVI